MTRKPEAQVPNPNASAQELTAQESSSSSSSKALFAPPLANPPNKHPRQKQKAHVIPPTHSHSSIGASSRMAWTLSCSLGTHSEHLPTSYTRYNLHGPARPTQVGGALYTNRDRVMFTDGMQPRLLARRDWPDHRS
jgi:hypothetical protein